MGPRQLWRAPKDSTVSGRMTEGVLEKALKEMGL
jgi:hypothetical protein